MNKTLMVVRVKKINCLWLKNWFRYHSFTTSSSSYGSYVESNLMSWRFHESGHWQVWFVYTVHILAKFRVQNSPFFSVRKLLFSEKYLHSKIGLLGLDIGFGTELYLT